MTIRQEKNAAAGILPASEYAMGLKLADQGFELGLVITPSAETQSIDRLAHLVAACGQHIAVQFEEAFAIRIVGQFEKCQHSRKSATQVTDPVVQVYTEHLIGQTAAPMLHQAVMLRDVEAEVA
jgi:hypothetical protein